MINRRTKLFITGAILAVVAYFIAPPDFRYVPRGVAIAYFVLAALSAFDKISRERSRNKS